MVDLYFTDAKNKRLHDCSVCPKQQMYTRKCHDIGLNNFPREKFLVDNISDHRFRFCPGKATWYQKTAETFQQCLFSYQTGIMPKDGNFHDQDEYFVTAYPIFVEYFERKKYRQVWRDVSEFSGEVFKAIGKMFGGK